MAVADPSHRRAGRPGPRRRPSRRDQRTGPGRRPRPSRRHRRPHPVPDRRPRPSPDGPVVVPSPRHRRRHTPHVPDRDHRADGRLPGPHRRARRPARPAPGGYRPGPGARRSAEPDGMAETGRLHRRLAGTIRPRRPRRSDKAAAAAPQLSARCGHARNAATARRLRQEKKPHGHQARLPKRPPTKDGGRAGTARDRRDGPADRSHTFVTRRCCSRLLNLPAHSPEVSTTLEIQATPTESNATEDPVLRASNGSS
jgi:hypothetical protein